MDWMLFFFIVLFDQAFKMIVRLAMLPGESIPVIPQVFHLTYVLNPGAAFGILEHQRLFFIAAGFLVLIAAAWLYPKIRHGDHWMLYGAMALLGGAAGNLIDRIESGLVVDFLDFRFWPVFNIADIAIVVGVGCMIYAILFRMKDEEVPR